MRIFAKNNVRNNVFAFLCEQLFTNICIPHYCQYCIRKLGILLRRVYSAFPCACIKSCHIFRVFLRKDKFNGGVFGRGVTFLSEDVGERREGVDGKGGGRKDGTGDYLRADFVLHEDFLAPNDIFWEFIVPFVNEENLTVTINFDR